ncbi:MFS general substrate transporter [Rhizodiscina lignyota]|uniref:MFS general substrate transporter n=1 Tax=Rhizodiscina lignyota TaxID=1504668 RepID=A0A9P4M2D2_9PEZI|nr:MFS general substrate transporter [Rhizodiscina lignyota]
MTQRDVFELGSSDAENPVTASPSGPDPLQPRSWPQKRRLWLASGPILVAFVGNFSISVAVGSIPGVALDFNVSDTQSLAIISIAAAGFLLAPVIAVSVSEVYGRRVVYVIGLPLSIVFNIVCALVHNYPGLMVVRFLSAFAIAPVVVIGIGAITDVWDTKGEALGNLMAGLYAAGQIWATEVGPLAGAGIVHACNDNWRWAFWLTAMMLGLCAIFILPRAESFPPTLRRNDRMRRGEQVDQKGNAFWIIAISLGRSCHMLVKEMLIWPTALLVGIFQGVLYFFYGAYPLLFSEVFGFTLYQSVMPFGAVLVGSVVGLAVISICDKRIYLPSVARAAAAGQDIPYENRLVVAIVGGPLMPVALFWLFYRLAWTAKPTFHWIIPVMAGFLVGVSFIFIMLSMPLYKNDIYGIHFGASALAADNIVRYAFSIAVPLFVVPMTQNLGFPWAISTMAFISLVTAPVPLIIFLWGRNLRARSLYVKLQQQQESQ